MSRQDRDFLVEIATLYYRDELSQQEIADRFGISRATVSNLLKKCREEGIVEIRILESPSLVYGLESELKSRFSLEQALVTPAEPNDEHARIAVGKAAADALSARLHEGLKIGISWGTTLYQVVAHLSPSRPPAGIMVAQLIGALGSINPRFDGFELARSLAERLRGEYRIIQAPLVVGSPELKEMLVREPRIGEALQRARSVEVALLGIGSNLPGRSALVRAGFLTADESKAIHEKGAVGVINGLHFDAEGRFLDCDWNDRVIGLSARDLRAIPSTIGVACGGHKISAILGALRGGLLKVLVTDTATAQALLSSSASNTL
jgi:DNA-binding transcriptional regulator LsrR (DeoR family)